MAIKPVTFSAPMVRALLAGTKTQTRRLFKPRGFEFYTHPVSGDRYEEYKPYRDGTWDRSRISGGGPMSAFEWGDGLYGYLPHAPGDRLYVREHWSNHPAFDGLPPRDLKRGSMIYTRADDCWHNNGDWIGAPYGKHRQAMHMPRWASRLWLEVSEARVQRLQDISEADAIAEGIVWEEPSEEDRQWAVDQAVEYGCSADIEGVWLVPHTDDGTGHRFWGTTPQMAYRFLWDSLHAEPGTRWADNPWIVAYSFNVHQGNVDA